MQNPNKVIFLDIDGVLNSNTFYTARESMPDTLFGINDDRIKPWMMKELDITALALLLNLVTATGANIVISSTWRLSEDTSWFRLWFHCRGITFPSECIIDKTSIIECPTTCRCQRGLEIEKWIKDNQFTGKYVIIDDDDDFTEEQEHHIIKTSSDNGLLWRHHQKALAILGKV